MLRSTCRGIALASAIKASIRIRLIAVHIEPPSILAMGYSCLGPFFGADAFAGNALVGCAELVSNRPD